MEHQTGPDGPAGTEEAEQAAALDRGEPGSGSAADGAVDLGSPVQGSAADSAVPMALEPEREPQPVPTSGEPRVDAALNLLDRLPGLPVSEHSEVFEQVHAQLSDVLGELDSGPALPAGG